MFTKDKARPRGSKQQLLSSPGLKYHPEQLNTTKMSFQVTWTGTWTFQSKR